MNTAVLGGSFKDPSGFVFVRDGGLYRQVNSCYADTYERVNASGLHRKLVESRLLIEHEEAPTDLALTAQAYRVLRPRRLPFVSYPSEWSFSALRDAALTTLQIERIALAHGFTLKDANATNVQFDGCRPIFIDSLSFAPYVEGRPWNAYGQFCRHFLAPLALMSGCDVRVGALQQRYPDGLPLDLVSRLLPAWTWIRPSLALHLHLHARATAVHAEDNRISRRNIRSLSRAQMEMLIESLIEAVRCLSNPSQRSSAWRDYYRSGKNYSADAFEFKEQVVKRVMSHYGNGPIWDWGTNTGRFARLAPDNAIVVALDADATCVDICYHEARAQSRWNVLPVVADLLNPTPPSGWANSERQSLRDRGPANLALALGLIHHLAIGNNVPLARIAALFSEMSQNLVVEFVAKSDSQVQRLLRNREDIFNDYSRASFEAAFSRFFSIREVLPIPGMDRVIFHMTKKNDGRT